MAGAAELHGWTPASFLTKLETLRRGDRGRAPHKPLLLLLLLASFARTGSATLRFREARDHLDPLLSRHGATGTAPSTADPFIYLASEGIWAIEGEGGWTLTSLEARNPAGGFTPEVAALLRAKPELLRASIATLLRTYFPAAQHAELAADLLIT